jgi:choline-sulfatase
MSDRPPEGQATPHATVNGSGTDEGSPGRLTGGLSRRRFLGGAAALAAGLALPAWPGVAEAAATEGDEARGAEAPSRRPNIVILMTDQERYPQHWPSGWARDRLPNRQRLARHGLTFRRTFCAASMCSPSRASIFTGLFPAEHGVTEVLQYGTDADEIDQTTLHPSRQNMAKLLESAGYDVQYRGKWHISKDPSGTLAVQSRRDLERYHFKGWLTPDAGGDESSSMFGGGDADYDRLTAQQAASFLRKANPRPSRPFALIVSLVNPHDVMGCPKTWMDPSDSDIKPYHGSANYAGDYPHCVHQDIDLPSTWDEIPWENHKPHAQWQSTVMWSAGLDPILSQEKMLEYVNFYAYLHKRSDEDMGLVLDALEADDELQDNTVVIRLSDHGEMGLAHGGMREKAYNAYEETMHVPLVISNPRLFPRAVHTDALASTVDLMPTLATLADVPHPHSWTFRGHDLTPIIRDAVRHPRNPTRRVQDSVMFTTDETIGTKPSKLLKDPIIEQPAHIRAIREERWKFAMYFDPDHPDDPTKRQYELYDLENDPQELHNMGEMDSPWYDRAKVEEMQAKLAVRMAETHTTPVAQPGVSGSGAGG